MAGQAGRNSERIEKYYFIFSSPGYGQLLRQHFQMNYIGDKYFLRDKKKQRFIDAYKGI